MPPAAARQAATSALLKVGTVLVAILTCALPFLMRIPPHAISQPPSPIVSSRALDEVRHLRVSSENPETSTNEHLDYVRCAALHNAIVKHAWEAGGHDPAKTPSRPTWTDESLPPGATERLHPDLIEFMKRSITLDGTPGIYNFFHFVGALNRDATLWEWLEGFGEGHIALYSSNDDSHLSSTAIIYDPYDHTAKFDFICHDDYGQPGPPTQWQRLETILSAWLGLIERGKIVTLHHSVDNLNHLRPLPDVPLIDEATGARQKWTDEYPWTIVSFAKQDLLDALDAWHGLIFDINKKLPEPKEMPFESLGLFSHDTLHAAGIRENSFAWRFFTNAWKPSIEHLGPGLRLASDEQLVNNPWNLSRDKTASRDENDPDIPIPLLVGGQTTQSWQHAFNGPTHQIPWGLYLEESGNYANFPVEDSCRLALPYSLGANGLAVRGDGSPLNSRHVEGQFELYQLGQHAWMPCHGTQLYMLLDAFARHVEEGLWRVGVGGVDEPDTVFQNADTEDAKDRYVLY